MITAIVLTLNEERHLPDCLASLAWADRRVVFDSFSTDRTLDIAREADFEVIQHAFSSYADQRNAALAQATSEWVVFVDADERVPAPLADEMRTAVTRPDVVGWWIPRHNYIFGRLTRHAGWYPDYQMRLLRRGRARYAAERPVHETVELDGQAGTLEQSLVHLNYDLPAEFVAKQRAYARLHAAAEAAQGHRARPQHLITRPLRQFVWRFVTLGGWHDGWHGLRLCLLAAVGEWMQVTELRRLESL